MDFFGKLGVASVIWAIIFAFASLICGVEEMKYGPYDNRHKVWHITIAMAFMCAALATLLLTCS